MTTSKIAALKQTAEADQAALVAETARLTTLGMKSADRYQALKSLKAVADASYAVYRTFATAQVYRAMDAVIATNAPARTAAARSRSSWKQAKFYAASAK